MVLRLQSVARHRFVLWHAVDGPRFETKMQAAFGGKGAKARPWEVSLMWKTKAAQRVLQDAGVLQRHEARTLRCLHRESRSGRERNGSRERRESHATWVNVGSYCRRSLYVDTCVFGDGENRSMLLSFAIVVVLLIVIVLVGVVVWWFLDKCTDF